MRRWNFKGPLKYRNTPTVVDGFRFDSKAEAKRYQELSLLESCGEIMHIDIHPVFRLAPEIRYEADFTVYYKDGRIEVEDVKGFCTKEYLLKEKLFNSSHPLAPIRRIHGNKKVKM